jgi:hypothetical protein
LGSFFRQTEAGTNRSRTLPCRNFEYEKINLNYIPRGGDDIDLLDELGKDGWELIAITANNIAYLKRQVAYAKKPRARSPATTPAPAASQR